MLGGCDIFYRSYAKDFDWLAYSLLSMKKYGGGFTKVHIAVPANDAGGVPVKGSEEVHLVTDRTDGYMAQQITKLHADEFCGAEYVLHVDSDCVFFKDFSPLDFFIDGKPIMLHEKCMTIWNRITERHLGWGDEYEYMRRLPIIYPRWMYKTFRDWFKKKHDMSVDDYIIRQNSRDFSEFNTMGQWAKRLYPDAFTWMDPKDVPKYCEQFWSWGGITGEIKDKIQIILAD
jgi:Family of unknown function (DUF6492)